MKALLWIIVIVIIAGGAYLYRNQISAMFMGTSPSPISYTTGTTSTTAPSTGAAIITWTTGSKGQYAVGPNSMTLYKFDKDTKGVSNCTGSCAGIWPPYTTSAAPTTMPANVTLITRSDGSMQFAYKGMPLYYYSGDTKVGDTNGDGFNGIWHLVTP